MRRRPMEFWWIAAYCAARSVQVFANVFHEFSRTHFAGPWHSLVLFFGLALMSVPALLLLRRPVGRWLGAVVLGVDAGDLARRIAESAEGPQTSSITSIDWRAVITFVVCVWMCVYLLRPSTARWFDTRVSRRREAAPVTFAPRFDFLCFLEIALALMTVAGARILGAPLGLALSAGIAAYATYGIFFSEKIRQRWDTYFARIEPGFPEDQASNWRTACGALARNDLSGARKAFDLMPPEAHDHLAGRLFEMALEWHGVLSRAPVDGRDTLRRALFDHGFSPRNSDRELLGQYAERASADDLLDLANARAEFIAALIAAASNPASFFRTRADGMLSRITGEAFAFNAPESWAAWWSERREQWTGDAGTVAIVARLLFCKCHSAAVTVALKIAGRAEEPLLTELALQVAFFNSIRDSAHGNGPPASFMNRPLQVLLVPEWADAAGWLHADSPILSNLNVSRRAAARRLALRPKMLDYTAALAARYPAELSDDLTWLLPLLSGKNFGMLRTRVKFDTWWPLARPSFERHARALNTGLDAFANGDMESAERAFRNALTERPNDLSARYNLSLCRLRQRDYDGAERLLGELTAMEPKEPYWWMALGDLHRSRGHAREARTAYHRAQQLGASEGRVALHLGLTFAHESRDSEAKRLFAQALGKNPTASKLEALAMQLENEGCWKLAGHYREEALRRELDGPHASGDNDRGDELA